MADRPPATMKEAVAAFLADLAERKKVVPPRRFVLEEACPTLTHAAIKAAIDGLYTAGEQAQLKQANDKVFELYELATDDCTLKPFDRVIPPINESLLVDDALRGEVFAWSGGSVHYHRKHHDLMTYSDEDKRKLEAASVRRHPQNGKILIDLRLMDLSGADLRFVKLSGTPERDLNLQNVRLKKAWLDFAQIIHCSLEASKLEEVHAVGLRVESSRFNGSEIKSSILCGLNGGSIFDGCFFWKVSCCGMKMHKGRLDDCHASHWQACKLKEVDFRASKFLPDSINPPPTHKFNGSAFQSADFRDVDFGGVAEFRYCQMDMNARGALFKGCDLRLAVLRDCGLTWTMRHDPMAVLRPASKKPGSVCGAVARQVARQVCGGGGDDDDDDDDEDGDDDDEGDGDDGGDEEGGEGVMDGLLGAAQERAEDSLLDLAEKGGAAMGARALEVSADLERTLQRQVARADKRLQLQMESVLKGFRAQARSVGSKAGGPEERAQKARGFDAMRRSLNQLASGPLTQVALDRAEKTLKEYASPPAMGKFLSAQLKRKTSYDVRGFFPMVRAVITTSPARLHGDVNEIKRLLAKFDRLDQPVLETTWTELTDTWVTLYEEYGRMQTERGKLIIEQIFDNVVIQQGVGLARQMHDIGKINEPPEDVLKMLKEAKVELKRRVDDYQVAADKEVVRMDRIRAKQQQLVGGIGILLVSVGTSVGNFASQYVYGRLYGGRPP